MLLGAIGATHERARARPPFDQPLVLQLLEGALHGEPRSVEAQHQIGFARQSFAFFVLAERDRLAQVKDDLLVFRTVLFGQAMPRRRLRRSLGKSDMTGPDVETVVVFP
jgi:hypothetical protein